MKVRVFVDHANLDIAWRGMVGRKGPHIAWEKLPGIVVRQLRSIGFIQDAPLDLRGISVYASLHPKPDAAQQRYENWLRFGLDQLPGYTVKYSIRQRRVEKCDRGHETEHFVEKGVDTKIACDMLSLGMRELYDIGVIVSDDADLVPSVECVQDILDKQIVHLGFKHSGQLIRSAAWSHLLMEDIAEELKVSAKDDPESGAA